MEVTTSLNRQIISLALPTLATLLAEPTLILVDTALVGRLGAVLFGGGFGMVQNEALLSMFFRLPRSRVSEASAVWNISYDAGTGLGSFLLGMVAAVFAYQGAFAAGAVVIAVGIVLTVADRVVGNHRLTEYNNTRARLRQIPVARRAVQTVRSVRGRVAAEPVPVDDLLTRPTEKPGWKDPEPDTPGT